MSINACTINSTTINSICSSRRAIIIENLLGKPAPVEQMIPHHPQHVNPNTRENLNIFRRDPRHEEENVVETHTLELPQIAVTVTMAGQDYTHTIDRGDDTFVPMINVYGIGVKADKVEESVNISDISIRIL